VTFTESRLPDTLRAVLFDLDGTLADTAPDLAAAANKMRVARGLAPLPVATLRPLASAGARGLLGAAFDIAPNDAGYEAMRIEFISNYETDICAESRLFDGIQPLLADLTERQIPWGIVTNKATRLTEPLVALLGMAKDAACVVCGDTTAYSKPHPAPLLHAAQAIGVEPAAIVYVGDALRDIPAGHAAGMLTIAAAYGYCGNAVPPEEWGADQLADTTLGLVALLRHIPAKGRAA
jgi:2-phosphoglycolate phosphatase